MSVFGPNQSYFVTARTYELTRDRLLREAHAYAAAGLNEKAQKKMAEYEQLDFAQYMAKVDK